MKHPSLTLILLIGLALIGCGPHEVASAPNPPTQPVADTLRMDDFTYAQYTAFDEALKPWYQARYFGDCMGEKHFRMNCIDCETVGFNVVLTIDALGKVADYHGLGYKIDCRGTHSDESKQAFYDCVLPSVTKIVLPAVFYGKTIEVFIGDHLGC